VDRFTRRSKRAYALVPAATLTLALPFYLAFVWAPAWPLALLFLTATMFLNYFYLTSAVTLVQEEVRPDQRVMSGALLLLIMNLIGLGLGPTFVGQAIRIIRCSWLFTCFRRSMLSPSRYSSCWRVCLEKKPYLSEKQSHDELSSFPCLVAHGFVAADAALIVRGANYVVGGFVDG
jgi:hypothetical protein